MSCGEESAHAYRPVGHQKTVDKKAPSKDNDETINYLKYRPRFMPCSAIESRIKNGKVYRDWNWSYSYDKKGRLEYANSIEVKEGKEIKKLPTDSRFWNARYAYDKKDRLKLYQRLTDKNLLFEWHIAYRERKTGVDVTIIGKQEEEHCSAPSIDTRKCSSELKIVENIRFTIENESNRALTGIIESKWRNLKSGTQLHFDYPKNGTNIFLGGITFLGWEFVVGQTKSLVGRGKSEFFVIDYNEEDDNALTRIRSEKYTTVFKAGEMCDK